MTSPCSQTTLPVKIRKMKNWTFLSCFKNSFTRLVFDAAVWTGGTASLIYVISLPGLIATFTGVVISMTLVSTYVIIIGSTFFCLSYPDQSCTNHRSQANCEKPHFDAFLARNWMFKTLDFEFWKKKCYNCQISCRTSEIIHLWSQSQRLREY